MERTDAARRAAAAPSGADPPTEPLRCARKRAGSSSLGKAMRLLLALAALTIPLAAAAASAPPKVSAAWSRPAAKGATWVVYMTLTSPGPADALVRVQSPLAESAMIHQSQIRSGVASMRMV